MPLPIITTSAVVGKDAVVRCPIRTLEGSRCQKDFVELAVGRPALPEGPGETVILICRTLSVLTRCKFWLLDV